MTTRITVADATCGHCKQTIETAVIALDGVDAAVLDLESHDLSVEHAESVSVDDLTGTISAAGYTPEVVG